MAARKSKLGRALEASLGEAVAWAKGDLELSVEVYSPPARIDVKPIRQKLGFSQEKFADAFGLNVGTVRDWEQGRRTPEGPARTLLAIIDEDPDVVKRVLKKATSAQG